MLSHLSTENIIHLIALLVLALGWYIMPPKAKPGKQIETMYGKTEGRISLSRDGREFYEWLGIPFADRPIGSMRFGHPEQLFYWRVDMWGIYDAKYYKSSCLGNYDGEIFGDENCLYLNIHVPKLEKEPGKSGQPLLPVMVYIHGGGFVEGTGNAFRPDYFMDENVVLVTLNYRLGIFGFLNIGDYDVPGNMGLKDQIMALEWIHDNIDKFGGDTKRITIFGHNSGAACVHYHLLSPLTESGLFHKAILINGAATAPWGLIQPAIAVQRTRGIAKSFKCPLKNSTELEACLSKKTASELMRHATENMVDFFSPNLMGQLFGPTIEPDGYYAFLLGHPFDLLKETKFRKVPILAGVTKEIPTLSRAIAAMAASELLDDEQPKLTQIIQKICSHFNGTPINISLAKKIKKEYFPKKGSQTLKEKFENYTKILSDCMFNQHVSQAIDFQRFHAASNIFYFNVSTGDTIRHDLLRMFGHWLLKWIHYVPRLLRLEDYFQIIPPVNVLNHGVDLPFLFPVSSVPKIDKDHQLYGFSKSWVKFLVSFASKKSVKDNLTFGGINVTQLPLKGPKTYLEVSLEPKMISDPFQAPLDFFRKIGMH